MKNWFTNLFNSLEAWVKSQVKDGESLARAAFATFCWFLILIIIPSIFTGWLGIRLSFSLTIWAFVMAFSIRPFMISVPEYAALVTINLLKHGKAALKEYPTGLSFRYPWEQVKVGNYINLRLIPLGKDEDYPSKDGPKMFMKWQAPYQVENSIRFIGVGREAVEDILLKAGSSVLSAFIARKGAQEAKDHQEEIEEALQGKFASMKLEELCGVKIPVVSLADLDYEDSVQEVRAAQYVARKLKEIAGELQIKGEGDPDGKPLSDSDALTDAMVINRKATLNVNEVKGEGGNALAALLMGMAQGGGGDGKNKEGGNRK